MNEIVSVPLIPTPERSLPTDDPAEILRFAIDAFAKGGVALATLVDIRGGSARAVGSQVAVSAEGRFCGYVSGGCVEAAVAAEALMAMMEGHDRTIVFGDGSPFFDIALPCGGSIVVAIHIVRDIRALIDVVERVSSRNPAALRYSSAGKRFELADPCPRSGWYDGDFVTLYRPCTRVVVSGPTVEAAAVASIAAASNYDVVVNSLDGETHLPGVIDAFTAVVLLHHDLDAEVVALKAALGSKAFYIGALGSTRTHNKRVERLREAGWSRCDIDRIKAPIGVFGPTRESTSLALSVLADVAACRLMVHG